jgi:hypothetical protein
MAQCSSRREVSLAHDDGGWCSRGGWQQACPLANGAERLMAYPSKIRQQGMETQLIKN